MPLAGILNPISILIQLIIVIIGCYAGYRLKIEAGYLFALAFLLYLVYDVVHILGDGAEMLSIINILASLSALGGIYLLVKQA